MNVSSSVASFGPAEVASNITRLEECDLCTAPSGCSRVLARGSQSLVGATCSLTTVLCRCCRFIYQPEYFSDQLLAALYSEDTSFAVETSGESTKVARRHLAERQRVITEALETNGVREPGVVLDIGGGVGECCAHLVERYDVWLADASRQPPVDERIRKVDGLFSEQLEDGSVDAVVMNHVLEHVFSPTELLTSAWRVLRDDGIAIIEVPFEIYTPLLARHLGDWRHVVYFTRPTLRAFLEKAGFRVCRLELETGCYGVRRLPVIRAVARKTAGSLRRPQRTSLASIARDAFAPAALRSLAARVLRRT